MSRRRRRPTSNSVAPRPLGDSENVRKVIREELSKVLSLSAGSTGAEVTTEYLQQLQQRRVSRSNMAGSVSLPRDPYNNVMFGPGDPLISEPISPLLPSGRPAPRQWEYPVTWNLQTTSTRSVPWSILRDTADGVSIVRSCIETCKSALTGLEWSFGIDSSRARAVAQRSNTSPHQVTADLQDKYADDIERLHQWWLRPARGWTFNQWLSALLEDEIVYDAVALYPRLTLGGDLLSLEPIDSSTIKPLLDDRGATPIPPLAAYQQILWGFPRGDYSASPLEEIDGQYADAVYGPIGFKGARTDTLIYKVRNQRTRSPYGFSCVEQALPDIDLWLKRWEWLRSEYTAGVTPEMVVQVEATMTPEQLRQYEAVFNDDLSGRTSERHRARFLPSGFTPSYPDSFDSKFINEIDLHLIRLVCAAFSVMPTTLGFVPNHNPGMGAQSAQKGDSDAELARGTKPRAKWVVDLINEISINWLGMPPEVSFTFHGLDDDDEQAEATLIEGYLNNGIMTLNETRDARNLPRYSFAQANEPFTATPTGPAFFNPSVEPVGMPGNLPSAPQNNPDRKEEPQPALPSSDRDERVQDVPGAETRQEQKAFMMFARNSNRRDSWRDFAFKSHDPDVAEAANRLAAAGEMDAVKALFTMHE